MGAVSNYEKYETSTEADVLQQVNYLKWCETPQQSSSNCSIEMPPDLCTLCFETERSRILPDDSSFLSWEDCLG